MVAITHNGDEVEQERLEREKTVLRRGKNHLSPTDPKVWGKRCLLTRQSAK